MNRRKTAPLTPSLPLNTLHIFAFTTLVVAYPLFAFLRANPGYTLTNDITPGILYALTAVLCIVLPSSIALIVAVTVNGRVEAVTKPFISMGAMKFNTTLPDHIFRQGENEVKIHLLPDNEHM
ncbi:MAG: hypothetical protein VCB26_00205 [Candidatus Hydrogenedentota bacterium]